jgi:succinoglycan biosynthesis protein ExoO
MEEVLPCCMDGITVAIPNWNHELVLSRSIYSALAAVENLQRQGVLAEVLVIDDSSRDGSLALLRQLEALYFNRGLRVVALARNIGLAAVRNVALRHARYKYILFMDADNEVIPENLFHFYRSIKQTRAAVVYGNLLSLRRDTGLVAVISNESFQDKMFLHNYIDAFSIVDREQLADAGGYDAALNAREDWELYLHLATVGKRIVFVPIVIGIYHDLPNSMIKESRNEAEHTARFRRVFNQMGLRDRMRLNTRRLRFHPDVGYL